MRVIRVMGVLSMGALLFLAGCGATAGGTTNTPAGNSPPAMDMPPAQTTAPAGNLPPAMGMPPAHTTAPASPAAVSPFVVTALNLDNEMPVPGENVTITCKITNTGAQAGTYKCEVKVDGAVAGTQDVMVAAGGSQTVSVSIMAPKVGDHTVSVGDQTRKMTSMDM